MANLDYRMALNLTSATRATREFPKPRPSNDAARVGLQYERRVGKELKYYQTRGKFVRVEHNPWFTFYDSCGMGNCCPDFLLWLDNKVIIVEVKLTWVEVAIHKLENLYGPVVGMALNMPTESLVICRNLAANAPRPKLTLSEALAAPTNPLLLWPTSARMPW